MFTVTTVPNAGLAAANAGFSAVNNDESSQGWNAFVGNQVPSSGRASDIDSMSEREFADYEMRQAHKLGIDADSSKYQRAYNDLVKAGLNPRLLLQSGTDTNMPTASSNYSYSQSDNKSESLSLIHI